MDSTVHIAAIRRVGELPGLARRRRGFDRVMAKLQASDRWSRRVFGQRFEPAVQPEHVFMFPKDRPERPIVRRAAALLRAAARDVAAGDPTT